jgi:CubicO group peptidase (beta-lactamase class C family)
LLRRILFVFAFAALPAAAQQPSLTSAQIARIDSVFSAYAAPDVPGCAVGVSRHDTVVLEKGWGSANLEHPVPITPATIFEAGSVSKQFTAAAVLRLAQQGKFSLDDDVREYIPELPQYDAPITIRHLLNHTSGLRDWGTVMSMAGWPRGTRTYTQAHVLDILSRQRSLNYPVGTEYLYSNSNYNLLAMIAERVSGKKLAEFTRIELFEPLGMTSTGWRDDYTRIVPGRAQAYGGEGKNWRLVMPFENVYGNSSLLTTVGDLLKWSANLAHKRVGGEEFVAMQQTRGKLKSGREITYAAGLIMDNFQGLTEIEHDGATAGYRAFLARYPETGYAVALLCNAGNVNPVQLGHRVATVVLPPYNAVVASRDTIGITVPTARLSPVSGYYKGANTDEPLHLVLTDGRLAQANGPKLVAISERHFASPSGRTHLVFEDGVRGARGYIRVWVDQGDTIDYVPVEGPRVESSLGDYVGSFFSEEADATVSILKSDKGLEMFLRPSTRGPMTPIYADGFSVLGSYMKFTRGKDGRVNGFLVTSGRARNVRFDRVNGK